MNKLNILVIMLALLAAIGINSDFSSSDSIILWEDVRKTAQGIGNAYYISQLNEHGAMPLADESIRYSNASMMNNTVYRSGEAIEITFIK